MRKKKEYSFDDFLNETQTKMEKLYKDEAKQLGVLDAKKFKKKIMFPLKGYINNNLKDFSSQNPIDFKENDLTTIFYNTKNYFVSTRNDFNQYCLPENKNDIITLEDLFSEKELNLFKKLDITIINLYELHDIINNSIVNYCERNGLELTFDNFESYLDKFKLENIVIPFAKGLKSKTLDLDYKNIVIDKLNKLDPNIDNIILQNNLFDKDCVTELIFTTKENKTQYSAFIFGILNKENYKKKILLNGL